MSHSHITLLTTLLIALFFQSCTPTKERAPSPESTTYWHDQPRKIRYQPSGEGFEITNGTLRFNRALYGSDTGFRAEAGDLPEFAFYLPGYGGTVKLLLKKGHETKWLIDAQNIKSRYVPGSMHYEINDPWLSEAIAISMIPLYEKEGAILKINSKLPEDVKLYWVYGGATGKKFNRDGDIGADPESVFYLEKENCATSDFRLNGQQFEYFFGEGIIKKESTAEQIEKAPKDRKGRTKFKKSMAGSSTTKLKLIDAEILENPESITTTSETKTPLIAGAINDKTQTAYIGFFQPESTTIHEKSLALVYSEAEKQRQQIANRITVETPDPYFNNLGGALAIAADGVWEAPSYQHGAIAWRKALVGWRGAYVADLLGWHDRADTHFSAYAKSQYTEPATGPSTPDPKKNLARQVEEKGTALFTSGYISRYPGKPNTPHHYDMNLVYIDQLLRHYDWTGDRSTLEQYWPLLQRHFAWEQRNFDPDNDGLYNAYACIWASDGLNYNGGEVAHSSAYNYYAMKRAGEIGQNQPGAAALLQAADKTRAAIMDQLWMPKKGTFAEYKDNLGDELLHPSSAAWTIYHLIDSEVPDPFQTYQMLRYVDENIPHIPVKAEGLENGLYTVSTSDWMPYTWSVNNVALAEVMHTALAYWQGNRTEEAFNLWKSALMESMYLGSSPANFQQLSFYDAMRGELYRDFADPIAMTARGLVEGLFGIYPQLLNDQLTLKPGFPESWDHAAITTPDISFKYQFENLKETYEVKHEFAASKLNLIFHPKRASIKQITVNGKKSTFHYNTEAIGKPEIIIQFKAEEENTIEIIYEDAAIENITSQTLIAGEELVIANLIQNSQIEEVYDPQKVISSENIITKQLGSKTIFVKVNQGKMKWWEPIDLNIINAISITAEDSQPENAVSFHLKNNSNEAITGKLIVNGEAQEEMTISPEEDKNYTISGNIYSGTNVIAFETENQTYSQEIINWSIKNETASQPIAIDGYFNDAVTQIFKNEYLSPRWPYPTLQLPIHGLGDWCSYAANMEIDDAGLKNLLDAEQRFHFPNGVKIQSTKSGNNTLFVSKWDNYPDSAIIAANVSGKHAYFLMTGTTTPMQSRIENGRITIEYTDGSKAILKLENPKTWWPMEQDYYQDGYAFDIRAPKPYRLHLKTGWMGTENTKHQSIGSFTKYGIDGGAATLYDLPIDPAKTIRSITVKATANEVIIGLMGVSIL